MKSDLYRGLAVLTDAVEEASNQTEEDHVGHKHIAELLDTNQALVRAVIKYAALALSRE